MDTRDDRQVLGAIHGILGGLAAAVAVRCASGALSSRQLALSIDSATPVVLSSRSAPAAVDTNGSWAAVSGETFSSAPLESYNKDRAVLIEQVEKRTTTRLGREALTTDARVTSRTWQDTNWSLVPPGGSAPGAASVSVHRDAVRLAYERHAKSVQDLTPAGSIQVPRVSPWYVVLVKLLTGVVDEETLSHHHILPLGVPATVLGLLELRDGRLSIGVHPALGMFVFRRPSSSLVADFRRSAAGWTTSTVVFGAVAAWQLWTCALYAWPSLPPLRRMIADWSSRWLGMSLPTWAALRNPAVRGAGTVDSSVPAGASAGGPDPGPPQADEPLPHDAPAEAGCVVCTERRRAVVLRPCGHLCMCLACARQIVATLDFSTHRCPLCRTRYKEADIIRVYGDGGTGS